MNTTRNQTTHTLCSIAAAIILCLAAACAENEPQPKRIGQVIEVNTIDGKPGECRYTFGSVTPYLPTPVRTQDAPCGKWKVGEVVTW